ncbi:MAG: DnaJ C-terminal domain-containing protein [Janthinobacterium lividum]
MKQKDYYKELGVARDASTDDIKQAYRKLAHKYHPDITKDPKGEEKFKIVAEAYATLKDPVKREEYDNLGKRPAGQGFSAPPNWQNQFGGGFDDVDMTDIFSAFKRGTGARQRANMAVNGQDFEIPVQITLEQIHGAMEVDVRAELPQTDEQGMVRRAMKTFRVRVPKGAVDGQRLRLAGKGGEGRNGGRPGDLYVKLELAPHRLYKVNGRDLTLELPLAPWEAVLGAQVEIPTLAGAVELDIKPGTTAGRRLRLPRRGLPNTDGDAGDLFVAIVIDVPKSVSEQERALYESLAAASTFMPRSHLPSASAGGRDENAA